MKKIFLILFVLASFIAVAQPGYTPITTTGYDWSRGKFQALHLPAGADTIFMPKQWLGAGAVRIDTVLDKGLWLWWDSRWHKAVERDSLIFIDTADHWVNWIERNGNDDSLIFYIGSTRYAVKDSAGGGGGDLQVTLNLGDSAYGKSIHLSDSVRANYSWIHNIGVYGDTVRSGKQLIIGGNSVSIGEQLTLAAYQRWPYLLCKKMGWAEINRGITGTTAHHYATGDSCSLERLWIIPTYNSSVHAFLINAWGINDANNTFSGDTSVYRAALELWIDTAFARLWDGQHIALTGPSYVDNASYTAVENFSICAKNVAADKGVIFWDMYHYMESGGGTDWLFGDQIHPNATGHDEMSSYAAKNLPYPKVGELFVYGGLDVVDTARIRTGLRIGAQTYSTDTYSLINSGKTFLGSTIYVTDTTDKGAKFNVRVNTNQSSFWTWEGSTNNVSRIYSYGMQTTNGTNTIGYYNDRINMLAGVGVYFTGAGANNYVWIGRNGGTEFALGSALTGSLDSAIKTQSLRVWRGIRADGLPAGGTSADSVLVVNSTGTVYRRNAASFAGSTPGFDDVAAVGQNMTANRTINPNGHTLNLANGGTGISIFDALNTVGIYATDISLTGDVQFATYGSGSITGIPTYLLAVDASGNVIESGLGSGSGIGAVYAGYGLVQDNDSTLSFSTSLRDSIISLVAGGSNFANSDLTFTGSRTHDADGNDLTIDNTQTTTINSSAGITLLTDNGSDDGSGYVLNNFDYDSYGTVKMGWQKSTDSAFVDFTYKGAAEVALKIGTDQTFHIYSLPYSGPDTSNKKLIYYDPTTNEVGYTNYAFAGGGGGSPSGNQGNIQLYNGGSFGTPGSDSLSYNASGLDNKGNYFGAESGTATVPSFAGRVDTNTGFGILGSVADHAHVIAGGTAKQLWNTTLTRFASTYNVGWAASGSGAYSAGTDAGISRNAAGVLEINSGTASAYRDLKLRKLLVNVSGSNDAMGTATLSSGTVTVSTSQVTASSKIFLTLNTPSGTLGILYSVPVGSISAGSSFIINSVDASGSVVTTDNSTINWWIVN